MPANQELIPIQPLAIGPKTRITRDIVNVPADHLPVLECFFGIEGEDLNIGEPRILLRVGGCRVGCSGCDTPHSWGLKTSDLYTMDQVEEMLLAEIDRTGVRTVAITGGEPMHYPAQMKRLAEFLAGIDVRSWLETSGLILDADVMDEFDYLSLDVKTPSSGPACFSDEAVASFRHFVEANVYYGQIKFIVTDQRDVDWISKHFADWIEYGTPPAESPETDERQPLVITPACGKDSTPTQVAERVQLAATAWAGKKVRVIAQQHALLSMR